MFLSLDFSVKIASELPYWFFAPSVGFEFYEIWFSNWWICWELTPIPWFIHSILFQRNIKKSKTKIDEKELGTIKEKNISLYELLLQSYRNSCSPKPLISIVRNT